MTQHLDDFQKSPVWSDAMKRVLFIVATLAMSCLMRASPAVAAADVSVKPLLTEPLPEYPGKEVEMIVVEYGPGGADPIHRHDAHGFIYVLEGSIVMGVKGGKEVTLREGETFHEGPDDIHTVGRNASKTKPARFLVFLIKKQGAPILTPVK
ncbi:MULTISPECIES: cupin domain-containing protein [Myxococcus]|uniref:cupin domain-containing protein n=1 Tax=Myxococcus TaxID=32 RepID=UPI001E4D49F1|nr:MULTISPECIES: cupin domain-containing protein [Myxococcus]